MFFFSFLITCFLARISSVIKNETQLLFIGTNRPLTFEFISWICIHFGKLFLITEADALKARLEGIKGQWGSKRQAPSLTALARFHYYPLTKTSIALCINSLKAPLLPILLNIFSVRGCHRCHNVAESPTSASSKLTLTVLSVGLALAKTRDTYKGKGHVHARTNYFFFFSPFFS